MTTDFLPHLYEFLGRASSRASLLDAASRSPPCWARCCPEAASGRRLDDLPIPVAAAPADPFHPAGAGRACAGDRPGPLAGFSLDRRVKGLSMKKHSALSLEMLYAEPSIIGTAPEGAVWSDGTRLAFCGTATGRAFRVWIYDVAVAFCKHRLTWLGDEKNWLRYHAGSLARRQPPSCLYWKARLHIVDANGKVREVEPDRREIGALAVAPDGLRLAFTSGGSLLVRDFGNDAPARVLVDSAERLGVETFQWSKDGTLIAFVQADNRNVRQIESPMTPAGWRGATRTPAPFPATKSFG